MDIATIRSALDTAIEVRRAFPEGEEIFRQVLDTYVSSPLKHRRERRRLDRVAELADEKIGDKKKEENLEEIINSTEVEPLIEAIKEDDRECIQEIWANMLAKFATGHMKGFRRDYILTLRKMEPTDVVCLDFIMSKINEDGFMTMDSVASKICLDTSIDLDDVIISINKLVSLGCVKEFPSSFQLNRFQTPYGRKLYQACQPLQ